jgi:hypothetical protein
MSTAKEKRIVTYSTTVNCTVVEAGYGRKLFSVVQTRTLHDPSSVTDGMSFVLTFVLVFLLSV